MPLTLKQKKTKMTLLAEQLHKHSKKTDLQCIIFTEGLEDGTVTLSGRFGTMMATSLIQQLYEWNPAVVNLAIDQIKGVVEKAQEAVQEQPEEATEDVQCEQA